MRIVFMGSPAFAVPALDRLIADGHTVPLVVTQPDRPAGRGQSLRPPAVKDAALRLGLPVLQPDRVAGAVPELTAASPDLIAVVAFGQYLPETIRTLPPQGSITVHASLLPKYRGAAPIAHALMHGDRETGVTIMQVARQMDTGPMLLQRRTAIEPSDDAGSLSARLATLGADALADGVRLIAAGHTVWTPQDDTEASLAPKLTDADCRLTLSGNPTTLVNRIRGLTPTPGAYVVVQGKRLRVLRAEAGPGSAEAGCIIGLADPALIVGTGQGALALLAVQPEGKRSMSGIEYARGRRLAPGDRLV